MTEQHPTGVPELPVIPVIPTIDDPMGEYAPGSPVRPGRGDEKPVEGVGLCLSGGGYRAMLFHLGVLWRLNEAGWLPRIDRVSSVSGGSITAGVLGLHWGRLGFGADGVAAHFEEQVVRPLRRMASTHLDVPAVLEGLALPFTSASDEVADKLGHALFGHATLQDLPAAGSGPDFVVNATSLETGRMLRFSRANLADDSVGEVLLPTTRLAEAVAASAAFPPFLSPYTLQVHQPWVITDHATQTAAGFRDRIRLTDGGVYDNLGLEAVWWSYRTVLVSDAGGRFVTDPNPPTDWAQQVLRVLHILDSQVRSLRRRMALQSFRDPGDDHDGLYVATTTDLARLDPGARPFLPADPRVTERLANLDTRLWSMADADQELLVNWGYVATDAVLLTTLDPHLPAGSLPYPLRPLR